MALVSVANEAEALDIVQDAMLKFATHYSDKPQSQWKPLFYRIVQNQIVDWHRKQKVRRIMLFWRDDEDDSSPWQADESQNPEKGLQQSQQSDASFLVLNQLPLKQQQCFMLRAWEGLSVKETAKVMKCSEGSVKTHFSRASQKLKSVLENSSE